MLCAYAINSAGDGVNTTLGCASVDVADSPTGSLDDVQLRGDGIDVRGWSVDPDTASSTKVHLYIDGAWAGITDASDVRNDIAAALPGYGADHGYDTYLPVAPGGHAVCAYGINAAGTGTDSPLGCRYFIVTGDPVGNLDLASSPEPGSAHLVGWAFEPDAPNTTSDIHVYIDGGFAGVFRADSLRKDVSTLFGVGEDHGYDITLDVLRGTHSICTYAINAAGPGTNTQLGCRSVTVR
jgi:hypothetical protein